MEVRHIKLRKAVIYGLYFLLFVVSLISIGRPRFGADYSVSVYSNNGMLLGARIAADGQWRFQPGDSVPYKFKKSLLLFEDEYFYYHPGVNPVSVVRALFQNIGSGRVVSGGSTVSMQVQRISRRGKRHFFNKILETVGAVGMELTHSKDEILKLYASHAPYGGNVVGLEAASWRYFGRPPHQLSWSESALLAVLPNSPSLIHPGRNRATLLAKRNRLLDKLLKKRVIDSAEYRLAVDEPLPDGLLPLPDVTPHLTDRIRKERGDNRIFTTIDYHLQQRCNTVVDRFHSIYTQSEIHNIALVVAETSTGNVVAYVGNSAGSGADKGHSVDVVTAKRSTGSLLKPFLFAAALQEGMILPNMLLPDVPTYYSDYKPENYSRTFDGAVDASQALSRSLNVPSVLLLHDYGVEKLLNFLHCAGLNEFNKPASHYGLSLILGGGESSLWSLTGAYASMARHLAEAHSPKPGSKASSVHPLRYLPVDNEIKSQEPCFDKGALWYVMEALSGVKRPEEEVGWENFAGGRKVAWKTGTSFGFRDAWAIGTTPGFTIGVWVGNASGEGRPGIIGGQAAAPIMFELFRLLPPTGWFDAPYDDMIAVEVCRQSGFLAGIDCPDADTLYLPPRCAESAVCRFHRLVHLSEDEKYRVGGNCYDPSQIVTKSWFVLPPLYEHYFKNRHPWYKPLPPVMEGCADPADLPLDIVYPPHDASVYLSVGFDGALQPLVVSATHRNSGSDLFWYVDDQYLGNTHAIHQKEIIVTPGTHKITIVDKNGNKIVRYFSCIGRGDE